MFCFAVSAQVFDYVVSKDGTGDFATIQEAIDACPDNERKIIFIKAGNYNEKVEIGSHTQASKKLLSIIGEDPEKVIINWNDYNGKVADGVTHTAYTCATFIVNAVDFYAENITVENTAGAVGPALALYNVGDRQTFKNCRIIGQQDTHRMRKGRRYYFKDSYIEGTVDYIYCAGPAIFDDCELRTTREGGYIVAPEDVSYVTNVGEKKYIYCFVFRNCLLTSSGNFEYYLGRPWKTDAGAVFINSKMQGVKKEGWSVWSGNTNHTSAFFAEYNSMDLDGNPLDISNRVDWSHQLTKDEIDTYYTPEKIYSFISGEYDPFSLVVSPDTPTGLESTSTSLSWNPVENAKGYIVFRNNAIIKYVEDNTYTFDFTDLAGTNNFSVKTVGLHGNLSSMSKTVGQGTGISDTDASKMDIYIANAVLCIPENVKTEIYTSAGMLVKQTVNQTRIDLSGLAHGIYLIKVNTPDGSVYHTKINK